MRHGAVSLETALARVLKAISDAEHPIAVAHIWEYTAGGYGWKVVEGVPNIEHGTDKMSGQIRGTVWEDISANLIEDLLGVTKPDLDLVDADPADDDGGHES